MKEQKWYRSPIDKEKLFTLKGRSNKKGLQNVVAHFLLVITTANITFYFFTHQQWLLTAIALFIHGTFYSFLGMAGLQHELIHKTVFKSRNLNEIFLHICSFLTWNNHFYYQASHIKHHQNTLDENLDREVILPQSFNLLHIIMAFSIDFFSIWRAIKVTWQNSCGVIKGNFANSLFSPTNPKKRNQLFNWARFILFGHITITLAALYFNYPIFIFLITLAPFTATWLNKLFTLSQHMGMEANVWDYRRNSRTIILNPFFSFLYWQMNYHIEHHMYPGVPFFNLKKLHQLLQKDLPSPIHGVKATWKDLSKINKQQKSKKNGKPQ